MKALILSLSREAVSVVELCKSVDKSFEKKSIRAKSHRESLESVSDTAAKYVISLAYVHRKPKKPKDRSMRNNKAPKGLEEHNARKQEKEFSGFS